MTVLPTWMRLGLVLSVAVVVGACGTVPMGSPHASMDDIRTLRGADFRPVIVAEFRPAPNLDKGADASVGVRAITLTAPHGSFSGYLKETLETQLSAAGLLDSRADRIIEGQLTDRQLDAAVGTGTGRLAARIVVRRAGRPVYDREVAVSSSWESSFVGAVAVPTAINEFTALFHKLMEKLVADPDFRRALVS